MATQKKKQTPAPAFYPEPGGETSKAYPVDTSPALLALLKKANGAPVEVSFRDLVPWIKMGERATHYLHPYPAKLLPQIAHFFLAASALCPSGGTVLDPFAGTGTVPLETILSGRRALFADANPLARFITKTKISLLTTDDLNACLERIHRSFNKLRSNTPPSVVNLQYWYHPRVINALCRLKRAIEQEPDGRLRDFALITFSATARKVSRADNRFSVPVRKKAPAPRNRKEVFPDVWEQFESQFRSNICRQTELSHFGALGLSAPAGTDARRLLDASGEAPLPNDSVDLFITSPPYAGAQKYVRASSLSLGWLGMAGDGELRALEIQNIGREHLTKSERGRPYELQMTSAEPLLTEIKKINPSRAAIAALYLEEMREALTEAARVLRPGGHFVLVIGDNHVCGHKFETSKYLTEMLRALDFELRLSLVDNILSRGLLTKRHKTANIITKEWILLLQKPKNDRHS